MAQAQAAPPSAKSLVNQLEQQSDRPRTYYVDKPCSEGAACGGEGIVLPFQEGNNKLDELFGFTNVEELPLSDEILPVIFDGALLTEEGVLDCFARHYPKRAALLYQLLADEGSKLGLGYQLTFMDEQEKSVLINKAGNLKEQINTLEPKHSELGARLRQKQGACRSLLRTDPSGFNIKQVREDFELVRSEYSQVESNLHELNRNLTDVEKIINNDGKWRIDDDACTVYLYESINCNVERMFLAEHMPFTDDGIKPLPTNKEGADWLYAVMGDWMARNGHEGAEPEEEFFRNWLTRKAAGVALVGLGALEMFGGVSMTIGSSGLGTVAGVALTTVGFDTLTNGIDMLWTPKRHAGERGWIGDLINDTATHFGNEEIAQAFNRGWAVTQIAVGLGAPLVIRYAAKKATQVAASARNLGPIIQGQLDSARFAIAEIKGFQFGRGLKGDYSALPSGRGAVTSLEGLGRFRIPPMDSDIRVLMRLRKSAKKVIQARFARLTRHQGPGIVNDQASAVKLLEKQQSIQVLTCGSILMRLSMESSITLVFPFKKESELSRYHQQFLRQINICSSKLQLTKLIMPECMTSY